MGRLLAGFVALALGSQVLAQEAGNDLPEKAVRAPDTLATLISLGAGLVAVVAVIYGCAWIIRRMNGMTGMNNSAMRVVSVMAVGTRERVVLVEVGGKQILLGITPSAIRTLHVFDEPVVDAGAPPSGDFARRLQDMIGKSWTSSTGKD